MDIQKILSEMTLEEKCDFASGADAWHTPGVERLGVDPEMMTDGPSGLRKMCKLNGADHYNGTVKATCFPSAATQACSWNKDLIRRVGQAIASEAKSEQVSVLLGPGLNMKRSPLCGRNFEYYSEDPYLAGQLAASFVQGVQSMGVGACAKHFAVNNQETRRFSTSANVDMRTLREIYLRAFEIVVKEAQPATIMHSYNRINGTHASGSRWLLTDILRGEWGFDGFVMSDWNAMYDRVSAMEAGCDLEMPGTGRFGQRDKELYAAVKEGRLDEKVLDRAIERILRVMERLMPEENAPVADLEENHKLASGLCDECIVLLKNEKKLLPLAKKKPLAVIGEFAVHPRYQGGGSSHVNPYKVDNILEYLSALNGEENTRYTPGYDLSKRGIDDKMISDAISLAKECGRAVLFVGMPDSYETEGRDREHLSTPEEQNALIEAVCRAVPDTVVVMLAGSPVEMPWLPHANALLFSYLGGQALGGGIARVLFGLVNPSGKLAETHPVRIEDTPAFLDFPGEGNECGYHEGIFIGYRWYEKRKIPVNFPFGYGLSYTTFAYTAIEREGNDILVTVKNTGRRIGKEVVELYVGFLGRSYVKRPVKELRAFEKVTLRPGESQTIRFPMDERWFAYWNVENDRWTTSAGDYLISVGPSSADTPLTLTVTKEGKNVPVRRITLNTPVSEIIEDPGYEAGRKIYFDGLYPMPEFAEEVKIHGYTLENKFLRSVRYYVPRMFIDRRNWPLQKIQSIVDAANVAIRGDKADTAGADTPSDYTDAPNFAY